MVFLFTLLFKQRVKTKALFDISFYIATKLRELEKILPSRIFKKNLSIVNTQPRIYQMVDYSNILEVRCQFYKTK